MRFQIALTVEIHSGLIWVEDIEYYQTKKETINYEQKISTIVCGSYLNNSKKLSQKAF